MDSFPASQLVLHLFNLSIHGLQRRAGRNLLVHLPHYKLLHRRFDGMLLCTGDIAMRLTNDVGDRGDYVNDTMPGRKESIDQGSGK
jgi:hypothetical protein